MSPALDHLSTAERAALVRMLAAAALARAQQDSRDSSDVPAGRVEADAR